MAIVIVFLKIRGKNDGLQRGISKGMLVQEDTFPILITKHSFEAKTTQNPRDN